MGLSGQSRQPFEHRWKAEIIFYILGITNLFYEVKLGNVSNVSRYPVNVIYGHPLVSNSNGKTKKDDKDVDYKSP